MSIAFAPSAPRTAIPRPSRGRLRAGLRFLWRILLIAYGWVPITPRGLFLLAGLGSAAWFIGVDRRDLVLLTAGCIVAGWMAISAVLVLLAGLWTQLRPQRLPAEPLDLQTDTPTPSGFSPGIAAYLPILQFDITWKTVPGVEAVARLRGFRIVELVTARQRGKYPMVRRHIRISDLFGLVRVVVRLRWDCEVNIVPSCGSAGELPAPRSSREGDGEASPDGGPHGDRVDQRRYAPGDPMKVVLWKAFARSGRMLVRTPERALAEVDRLRLYFVASDADEATAGVARAALVSGALGHDFAFAADGDSTNADSVDEAVKRLVASAHARGHGGEGLARFLDSEPDVAGAMLFVPAKPGRWIARVSEAIRTRPGTFRAVIGVDGPPTADSVRGWSRLLKRRRDTLGRDELAETIRSLKSLDIEVVTIDRTTGRIL